MTTITIALPDELRKFAEHAAIERGFASTDQYIAALMREDLRRVHATEAFLLRRVESGAPVEMAACDLGSPGTELEFAL